MIINMGLQISCIAAMQSTDALTVGSIVAVLLFLNSLGIFALLFKVGKYIGETDRRMLTFEDTFRRVETSESKNTDTLRTHGESLIKIETDLTNVKSDVRLVRDRQHQLANVLSQVTLRPITLNRTIEGREGE